MSSCLYHTWHNMSFAIMRVLRLGCCQTNMKQGLYGRHGERPRGRGALRRYEGKIRIRIRIRVGSKISGLLLCERALPRIPPVTTLSKRGADNPLDSIVSSAELAIFPILRQRAGHILAVQLIEYA
jgi:hypothetical protein